MDTPQPAFYSAVGTQDIRVIPTGATVWFNFGHTQWTAQQENGAVEGNWYSDGELVGRTVGNANAGSVGLIMGLNMMSASGAFSGNNLRDGRT
ncbi:hypothetical protein [Deinococcus sp. Leaf326]|uniref:hypothetical protein n=1 Tax=Deinococcus sp. Leaf326 TaxID=1736338 RepID=UPI000B2F2136|nr:hypothetical protein [Deinococcus sp. Leaf326]